MRYERKYVINRMSLPEVMQIIKLHPASFREIFPPRKVNNIYFDTIGYAAYQDNLKGIGLRKKIRLRWYGDSPMNQATPQIEEKIKEGELGYKITHSLSPDNIPTDLKDWELPIFTPNHQIPTLYNAYNRFYFLSGDHRFRITIDTDLVFAAPPYDLLPKNIYSLPNRIILELKYNEADAIHQDAITQHLPFRLNKHSKYVIGVQLIT